MKPALQLARGKPKHEPLHLVHHILVLDAFLTKPLDCQRHVDITTRFIDEILSVLNMQPLAELGIYPAVDQRAPGWSFIQPITTSHISAHYFEKPGRMPHIRLDAYSCESIDRDQLIDVCHKHFSLSDWHATFIDRRIDRQAERIVVDLTGVGQQVVTECRLSPTTPSNKTRGDQCVA